jgi:DNA invertase Pin-like site-specific DNA recombinase
MTAPVLADQPEHDDPLAELREIRALRTELDRREAGLVRRARTLGFGWQMIATALGVSRQAVHKRFGRR